jgi:hypothetical protein
MYPKSNPNIAKPKQGNNLMSDEDQQDDILNNKMVDSSIIEDKQSDNDEVFNLRETVYQPGNSNIDRQSVSEIQNNNNNNPKPTVETGNLALIKSERDLTHKDKIFQSDRTLEPYQDTSYKLIQNKNGKQSNSSWNLSAFQSPFEKTAHKGRSGSDN